MESWEASEPKVQQDKETQKSQTTSPNNGRPEGTDGIPKESGASTQKFSYTEVVKNIVKSQDLEKDVEKALRKIHN